MERCNLDTGLTYSNIQRRETVMVIALASSPAEFLNSFVHELRHMGDHILKGMEYTVGGEDIAYLTGNLCGELWEDIHPFICCKCKKYHE